MIVNVKILISTSTHSIISFILCFGSVFSYYSVQALMSANYNSEIFNSFQMNFSSLNFYFSTIILVLMCLLFDLGINRLLLLFGFIADPLKIKAEEYEEKTLFTEETSKLPPKEINNHCNFLLLLYLIFFKFIYLLILIILVWLFLKKFENFH